MTAQHGLPSANADRKRIEILDPLRGLAAAAVAWFHFTHGNPGFLHDGVLKASGEYGWTGVVAFFVISGFVLPYSMYRGGYTPRRDWQRFIAKRVVRLDPPYLATIALVLGLQFLSMRLPGYRGVGTWDVSVTQVLLHLGYLNAFVGYPWLNPVFWTLAIEFQYYVLIALVYPLLMAPNPRLQLLVLVGALAASIAIPANALIFHHLGVFALGVALFAYKSDRLQTRSFLVICAACVFDTAIVEGVAEAVVALGTVAVILGYRWRVPGVLRRLGLISYSLYLVHVPVGGRVINLSSHLPYSLSNRILGLIAACVASLTAASLLYLTVERPARRWSSAIRYSREPREFARLDDAVRSPAL